jgi:hypothetical protein
MVHVGMRQEYAVKLLWIKVELAIAFACLIAAALIEATV